MKASCTTRLIAGWMLLSLLPGAAAYAAEVNRSKEIADIRTQLAAGYYARGQYTVALEEVRAALAAVSDYAPAYNVQALVYMDLKEWATAEENFLRALRIDPTNADANHNFGWFLCGKRERYAEGVRYFLAALKNPLYTKPEKSLQQAGLCALKVGDLVQAEENLYKADRAQPNNPQTVLGLAQLAFRRKDYVIARQFLQQQARLASPSAESLWLNVRVERKLGQADSEAGFARELRARFSDSEEALLLAAGKYE